MSTTSEVNPDLAQKESPGQHKAERLVVRIVVVPNAGSPEAPSRASHESHGLTDDQLKAATAHLEAMPPPPSSEESPSGPKNMFEALEPTDIVAVGKEAASVRVVAGQESVGGVRTQQTRELNEHNERHRDTVLKVWTESDTVEYQCEKEFAIVGVKQVNRIIDGAPGNLFERDGPLPYEARKPDEARKPATTGPAGNPVPVWKWTSGTVPKSANDQQYKMTFKIKIDDRDEGELVDPDVVCGDPPPSN
jgi:hypothetical protein